MAEGTPDRFSWLGESEAHEEVDVEPTSFLDTHLPPSREARLARYAQEAEWLAGAVSLPEEQAE